MNNKGKIIGIAGLAIVIIWLTIKIVNMLLIPAIIVGGAYLLYRKFAKKSN